MLLWILLALPPALSLASNREESLFEIAYWDFQNGNCPNALNDFASLLRYAEFESRARLYLSLCQYHIKNDASRPRISPI